MHLTMCILTSCHLYLWKNLYIWKLTLIGGALLKNLLANVRDTRNVGLIPGSVMTSGAGSGNPHQYFCLGNPMDRGAWQAAVHGVPKSRTWLNTDSIYIKNSNILVITFLISSVSSLLYTQSNFNMNWNMKIIIISSCTQSTGKNLNVLRVSFIVKYILCFYFHLSLFWILWHWNPVFPWGPCFQVYS